MRLKTIRLAGFKSFVDPTSVHLPGQLVGIVGPNGCGKSNVIDAVRWVMGESSARHLRGESMTDVIFNGSGSRKPVGQASIELVFDNSEGALGGKYASYAEISVKRQVNREAQSQYFLNGARCRRRDVTDVFLGTGLGPRSYAIIEQGMISRIIEAKPEELRVYLEEAAGISLYKERRRETERRIRDTRENMDRLNDVREEVGRQLEKLSRQAKTAERYRTLKADERRLRAELLALRLRGMSELVANGEQDLLQRQNALESAIAGQRAAERDMTLAREQQAERGEALNAAQGEYYQLGSEIARIEQQISHHRDLQRRRSEERDANRRALDELAQNLEQDLEKQAALQQRLKVLQPDTEAAVEQEQQAAASVQACRSDLDAWQKAWEQFNARVAESVRQAEIERTRIEQLEEQDDQLRRRLDRLLQEREGLETSPLQDLLAKLERVEADHLRQRDEQAEAVTLHETRLAGLRTAEQSAAEELQRAQGALQQAEARRQSLETLQQHALGDSDAAVRQVLDRLGLDTGARLAREIRVDAGWEHAVERVLEDRLQAVCGSLDDAAPEVLAGLESGSLTLVDTDKQPLPIKHRPDLPDLASRVDASWPVAELLAHVYCADSLEQAMRLRGQLAAGESLVCADGHWIGPRWMRWTAASAGGDGALARQRELDGLKQTLAEHEAQVAAARQRLQELQEQRDAIEQALGQARQAHAEAAESLSRTRSQRQSEAQRLADMHQRLERLDGERQDIAEQRDEGRERLDAARGRLQEALDQGEGLDQERDRLENERGQASAALEAATLRHQECRDRHHELALKLREARTVTASLDEQIDRLRKQQQRLQGRAEELDQAISEDGDPTAELETRRQGLLQQRSKAETALASQRQQLGEVDARLRELDQQRLAAETRAEELRSGLEAARLRHQEQRTRRQTLLEQFEETERDLEAVQAELPGDASEEAWLKHLSDIENRISRLGSINLAAIEEHAALDERNSYLQQQHADLEEALETLESAMRRIDRETRVRFRDTFDRVNAGLRDMYPRLFGGGEAYLELTGEDLLDTGVSILARPPGKRISTIHLLSGGEKALTAVAMIFAIFALNPAPFCMLDEVDAPLDEANVGRFCQLVQEMSKRVQFVFITHNKGTMEIASHLMGVTMYEPGVSRLVAVDVDEAADMVEA
ncbi:chromosome segregation protein SMC [Methylonatrum kenyense]|uniref:chromosome segregation protein SMC n=1 Tax=Methylonatrum kenyense TaxID=455253 RepID=UPI0020BF4139|nr:chromosome segregation protein SMC [Methylonatrum kenyense]MCK8515945.1 chromosome segregation protein SMC [Methylonatrum kenyense]